jgi:hypothetical protein
MAVKIPQEYLSTDHDFGFSGVSEEEYRGEIISKADAAATSAEERATAKTSQVYKRKLADIERQIMPLLVNLLKTADKEYIHWPNREAQIEDKIEQILAITRDD